MAFSQCGSSRDRRKCGFSSNTDSIRGEFHHDRFPLCRISILCRWTVTLKQYGHTGWRWIAPKSDESALESILQAFVSQYCRACSDPLSRNRLIDCSGVLGSYRPSASLVYYPAPVHKEPNRTSAIQPLVAVLLTCFPVIRAVEWCVVAVKKK